MLPICAAQQNIQFGKHMGSEICISIFATGTGKELTNAFIFFCKKRISNVTDRSRRTLIRFCYIIKDELNFPLSHLVTSNWVFSPTGQTQPFHLWLFEFRWNSFVKIFLMCIFEDLFWAVTIIINLKIWLTSIWMKYSIKTVRIEMKHLYLLKF